MPFEMVVIVLLVIAIALAVVALFYARSVGRRIASAPDGPEPAAEASDAVELPQGAHRIAVILNPSKNKAASAKRRLVEACASAGLEPPVFFETTPDDAGYQMTRDALEGDFDTIIAAGGDGTVRVAVEVMTGHDKVMSVLPLGTGNLLARNLDIDVDDDEEALSQAVFGTERKVDSARVRLTRADGTVEEKVFAVIAGVGFDAEMMEATDSELKARLGAVAYAEAGFRQMAGHRKTVRITIDDAEEMVVKTRSVMVANCGKLQGGLVLAPDAVIDDGLLDVVVMSPRSVFGWGWIALRGMLKHRSKKDPIIDYYQGRRVTLRVDEAIAAQLDGDTDGEVVRMDVEVLPGALEVRC
ncbi:diacylglycerol kinase family lipid kinase [Zhihengliuella sp.]|uniref:diacylglycerol/lipid kinase family protein n=1 Tax=Zhihengliuella sp. TaxID=1954483 RepID=UPI0028125E10|nr:diacylglycerol kinase family lipid kinase [Zhihengliuella sp.]